MANDPLAYETPETRRDARHARALARGERLRGWAAWSLGSAIAVLGLTFASVCVGVYAALVKGPLWWLGGDGNRDENRDLMYGLVIVACVLSIVTYACCCVGFFETGRR